jgi:hypothetical protein
MNQVLFTPFHPSSPRRAVGTRNLNGCIVVAIVSSLGAILAHIPPQPYPTLDPAVGPQNVQAKMSEVVALYQQHASYFPPGGSSLVVGPFFQGQIALSHHLDQIKAVLTQHGLTSALALYEVSPGGHPSLAQGTVFMGARQGPTAIYVEDRLTNL